MKAAPHNRVRTQNVNPCAFLDPQLPMGDVQLTDVHRGAAYTRGDVLAIVSPGTVALNFIMLGSIAGPFTNFTNYNRVR
jgi:hypothetical protein